MSKPSPTSQPLTVSPVYLAARAVNHLVCALPAGTASFIGIVFLTRFTGQLVHHPGSRARATLPYGVPLRWGWPRGERARARGTVSLEARFARALTWCLECVPVEPVRWGQERRPVPALDFATVARLRANTQRCARLGTGSCQRAQRAVPATLGAALTTVVLIRGVRVGLVRRTRFGATCAEAVTQLFAALPACAEQRLVSVDAGIATLAQFGAATEREALGGACARTSRYGVPLPPSAPASGVAPRCMGRCCLPGPSAQKGARMKT